MPLQLGVQARLATFLPDMKLTVSSSSVTSLPGLTGALPQCSVDNGKLAYLKRRLGCSGYRVLNLKNWMFFESRQCKRFGQICTDEARVTVDRFGKAMICSDISAWHIEVSIRTGIRKEILISDLSLCRECS